MKNADNFFKEQGIKNFKEFYKKMDGLHVNERLVEYRKAGERVAEGNNWKKHDKFSEKFGRDIYTDDKGTIYSLDKRHGRFEVLDSKGYNMGEIDFEGTRKKVEIIQVNTI